MDVVLIKIHINGYRIYVYILTRGNDSIELANMDLIYGSFRSSSSREGDCGYNYFSQLQVLIYEST